jgi:hypothetical protein
VSNSSIEYGTSAKIAQYIPRCLPLYAPASSSVVPWRPRCIGSLSQGSYRMRGSRRDSARRERTSCRPATRSHSCSRCADNWRPSASWSGARNYGTAGRGYGLKGCIVAGCLLQATLWREALLFARRLGHCKRRIRRAQWLC